MAVLLASREVVGATASNQLDLRNVIADLLELHHADHARTLANESCQLGD